MVGKCMRVSGRLVVSAAISWSLIPIANADAPQPSDKQSEITDTAAPGSASGEAAQKLLHTVPEDGMGDTKWLSGATRIVREITLKRSKEDLIICIAGCVPKQDRVVYAQPTEYVAPKPDATASETSGAAPKISPAKAETEKPAAKPATTANAPAVAPSAKPAVMPAVDAKPVEAKPAEANPVEAKATEGVKIPAPMNASADAPAAPVAAPADAKPAISPAASATAPADLKKIEFVPSMSKPKIDAAPMEKMDGVKADAPEAVPQADSPKAEQPK